MATENLFNKRSAINCRPFCYLVFVLVLVLVLVLVIVIVIVIVIGIERSSCTQNYRE